MCRHRRPHRAAHSNSAPGSTAGPPGSLVDEMRELKPPGLSREQARSPPPQHALPALAASAAASVLCIRFLCRLVAGNVEVHLCVAMNATMLSTPAWVMVRMYYRKYRPILWNTCPRLVSAAFPAPSRHDHILKDKP